MKNDRLAYLLNRVMSEQASEAEHTEMLDLIADPTSEADVKSELFNAYKNAGNLSDVMPEKKHQILQAIFDSDKPSGKISYLTILKSPGKWAAAALLFISLSVGIYLIRSAKQEQPQNFTKVKQDVLPGGNQATLTLADGSIISLTEAAQGKIAGEAGLTITKPADGRLLYEADPQNQVKREGYNTITTPLGGKYEVILQDGTQVFLNSGSKIVYPVSFNHTSRKVTLVGEAYFQVSKDPRRPFIVSTPPANGLQGQDIEVLGTHFNINAYEDENSYVTTLVEGSVKVVTETTKDDRLLIPGQQSVLSAQSLDVRKANVDAALAWRNNFFYFTDLPVKNMMRQLARWYNIEVIYEKEIPAIGFWGQISMNKKLSEVLELIEETNGAHFRIEGRKVFVSQ